MTDPTITSPTVLLQRMAPLLRSITTELRERSVAIDELTLRMAAVRRARGRASALLASLEARAAAHEREIERSRAELLRLGWQVDDHDGARLVYVGRGESLALGE